MGNMKRIVIEFVPQHRQNYDSVGDYGETDHNIWFKITAFPDNPGYSIAILLHEILEFYRNKQEGITIAAVDAFDYGHPELDDPGLSKEAPYHKPHMEADTIERLAILFFGEDWVDYEAAINKLFAEVTCH
jgi:hypothetical protein